MKLAPFRFKEVEDHILITNDLGRYCLLSYEEFYLFVNLKIREDSLIYKLLCSNYFIIDGSVEAFVERVKPQLRRAKNYLFSATALHIFVVTNFCNSECIYCQAKSNSENCSKHMDRTVAQKAVDIALSSPQESLDFEFQGGEPLSNFDIIKYIIEYTDERRDTKNVTYNVVSNLTMLTKEMITFFAQHNVSLSTSLDGDEEVHNYNRPLAGGCSAYSIVVDQIQKLRESNIYVGAIQTTTKKSLLNFKQIIDAYVKTGMDRIFIRPLTPLGYAADRWNDVGYTEEEFLCFYQNCLQYILELNLIGSTKLQEGHACIFLKKILCGEGVNYMELRSPCGAAVGQMAYYYDGNIFTCDEARMLYEMGDDSFRIGNVFQSDYDDLLDSTITKVTCKYSILESLPRCSDCVYNCYCGTCPVVNYALENDVVSRKYNNYKCKIYEGMLNILFKFLMNDTYRKIFEEWV